MGTTEAYKVTGTKLSRIAWLSGKDSSKKFECLMHLFNYESLKDCFHSLDERKAVGIDGIDKASYAASLEDNIKKLVNQMKNMAYKPGPVREVLIPKEGKLGAKRPLGISNLEDKIVQEMMKRVLNSIYEPVFLDCSYGFRPGRGCHDAIEDLQHHMYENELQTVIDIDLKNFFGTIDHDLLKDTLELRIKDPRFMRYVNRMLKSGVLTDGELKVGECGTVQGSICSPILANVFAHHVIDTWIEGTVKVHCKGKIALFRYADDMVICCQCESDAIRIKEALAKRLNKFKLELNEEKTKLVPFNKFLASQGIEQGTFDFLGFTFYLEKSKTGRIIPKLKTRGATFRIKLSKIKQWIRRVRNELPLDEIWDTFVLKMKGHIAYYSVSFNTKMVERFVQRSIEIVFKWLNRRSQRKSFTWEDFGVFLILNPPPAVRVIHRLF